MSSQGACFHDGGAPAVASGKVYGLYSFPGFLFPNLTCHYYDFLRFTIEWKDLSFKC